MRKPAGNVGFLVTGVLQAVPDARLWERFWKRQARQAPLRGPGPAARSNVVRVEVPYARAEVAERPRWSPWPLLYATWCCLPLERCLVRLDPRTDRGRHLASHGRSLRLDPRTDRGRHLAEHRRSLRRLRGEGCERSCRGGDRRCEDQSAGFHCSFLLRVGSVAPDREPGLAR